MSLHTKEQSIELRLNARSWVWSTLTLHLLLALYFLERWLIRPKVAGLLGQADTVNFGVPDIFVLILFSRLFSTLAGRQIIVVVLKFFTLPLLLYFVGGFLALFLNFGGGAVSFSKAFWASGQLAFSFFVLGPVLVDLTGKIGFANCFLNYAAWIGLAGFLSITDRVGITNFGSLEYFRQENVILGVNGFYIVGPLTPYYLFSLIDALNRKYYIKALIVGVLGVLGFIGLAYAGVRSGLAIAVGGGAFGAWICLRYSGGKTIAFGGAIIGLTITGALIAFVFYLGSSEYPLISESFINRAASTQGLFYDDDRLGLFKLGLNEIRENGWVIGRGINQWVMVNSNEEPIHNVYIQAWWESGLLGLLGWILLYLKTVLMLLNKVLFKEREPEYNGYIYCAVFGLLSLAIAGMVYPVGYSRADWILFLLAATPLMFESRKDDVFFYHSNI
ncbi:MAG: hypothetical protein PHQ04_04220 [Opitutaceae bacterium]|nr:hypothetical protein [Opitutaceae bacterium]